MADSGSTGRGTAAASVGGSRTALARRSNTRSGGASGGAQGANSGRKAAGGGGGILKFYSDDAPGLKVGPTTVLVLSLVFMAIVCSLHILGKFRSG